MGYAHTGNWTWEFYPPPYDWLAPRRAAPMPAPILFPAPPSRGMSGCGCGGSCGGCGGGHVHGMGLFDSGLDFTGWGVPELAVVALGVYLVGSVLGDAGRARTGIKRAVRRRRTT